MEQREWITRAMDGDRTARAHLFEETIQPVYYLCLKLTGSSAQAGELTRRTFARAFSHLGELRPDAGFDRWVTAIAVNLCRQTMKKAQPWLFTTDEREMAILSDTYVADEACLPPECTEDANLRTQALRTISLLPPEQRVAMVLRYVAMMKPHQIAKTMDVDELTILGRLNCGRRALMTALPSPRPEPLLPFLFAGEAASVSVPEVLRGSCMQTVMNAEPEPAAKNAPAVNPAPAPEPEPEPEDEETPSGLLKNLTKKQKTILFSGIGAALALLVLILALALRGCSKEETPIQEDTTPPAAVEEEPIDENLEAAEKLREYGVEVLLRCNRREADELRNSWGNALSEYVSSHDYRDLELETEIENDAVTEVRLSLEKAGLDITRLKDLGCGDNPEIEYVISELASSRYDARCYRHTPLFDPAPLQTSSLGIYYDGCRYELQDENGDGSAEYMIITRIGEGYDPDSGTFHPYGSSLTNLMGRSKSEAEALLGQGEYEDGELDVYTMSVDGATADDANATVRAIAQARSSPDAARENINALVLRVNGCFAELLPELQLPEGEALSIDRMSRKLSSMRGKVGYADGDVFKPFVYDGSQSCVYYYEDNLRYLFVADGIDDSVEYVEVLDLSDCRLWDRSSLSFRRDGFDLADLLGLDRYTAYTRYGIRSYPSEDQSYQALGLWEEGGVIATVNNAADPRAVWDIHLGDTEEGIQEKAEKAGGYLAADESETRYVIPGSRELVVTYTDGKASVLRLEDHSRDSDYQPPERKRKTAQQLFREFLDTQSDVKSSWFGDLTHDGEGDLLVCRESAGGCLVQLYVTRDEAVVPTPVFSQTLSVSSATDLYALRRDDGPVLLFYSLSESFSTRCTWRLVYFDAGGNEVQVDGKDVKLNDLDVLGLMTNTQEEYDEAKQQADGYAAEGTFLCGTRSGSATFGEATADLGE